LVEARNLAARQPLEEYWVTVDRLLFRDAMSRLGAAVSVITTEHDGQRYGFTASAVCSVTDDPPTLLVCMNRGASTRAAVSVGSPLCVNVLSADQQELAATFARRAAMEERFRSGAWDRLVTGAPALRDAAVCFDGPITNIVEVGTHSVLFAEVKAVRLGDVSHGLVYFDRDYHSVGLPGSLLSALRGAG